MGIDVGGTHTKAVAIDSETGEMLGKIQVKTTHDAPEGVAKGVVECFVRTLEDFNLEPDEVVFLAHSTTQATNALLEGDVADVGIVSVAGGFLQEMLAKRQTDIKDIELVTGRKIKTNFRFLKMKDVDQQKVERTVNELTGEGAQVIVATQAFGVDDGGAELFVSSTVNDMGLPSAAAHEISKLYGLTVRTRTAVINASILPKMLETANSTQESIAKAGITAPLMIMRGDGGVMTADEMKRRPILSMLSGPTASVIGALMYLRASDGIYFEVGGTSTNIGVIKNGRPTVSYATLAGYRTYVTSLDVRVLGVAGGSMVRVKDGRIFDVGPRSAHIAGLNYSAFTDPADIVDPEVELFCPKPGDPDDYVSIRLKNGDRVAITNSCAAIALDLVPDELRATGTKEACLRALAPLAKMLNLTVEETATAILTKATDKVLPVVQQLIEEYKLDADQSSLVGCGGGAGALIPFTANRMGIGYQIPDNAEVISSIGVALAMVREVVERIIPNPTEKEIQSIRREAIESAIKLGAEPESIETVIEIDTEKQRVRVTATGATELKTDATMITNCTPEEALRIASESLALPERDVELVDATDSIYVYTSNVSGGKTLSRNSRRPVRIIDKKGFIRIKNSEATFLVTTFEQLNQMLIRLRNNATSFKSDMPQYPDLFVIVGSHIVEASGVGSEQQLLSIVHAQISDLPPDEKVILVAVA